jgi:TP53 regulating kinase-like protein
MERMIARGAEADLILTLWNGRQAVVKIRKEKKYRHPELDQKLRKFRTIREADIIYRAKQAGVSTPLIYHVNLENSSIVMEYIKGTKVRDIIDNLSDDNKKTLFTKIGYLSGILHKTGIIHGDLTTSNIIKQEERIVFIDFGLAENSFELEKRGVDLNLMKRMLSSTHFNHQINLLEAFKEGYHNAMFDEAEQVLQRMVEVAERGRYIEKKKNMDGNE